MAKQLGKKTAERRKKPRSSKRAKAPVSSAKGAGKAVAKAARAKPSGGKGAVHAAPEADRCYHCSLSLGGDQRALFVEEEVGRVFCSEQCITSYFAPDIARLEKEFLRRISASDLSPEERESLAHLRWITLQEPDEVWREKTLSGDHRYTLISEFKPGSKTVWCVCVCLFLRGEPSFLHIAFPTRNAAMVNQYRRGERIEWERPAQPKRDKDGFDETEESAAASASAEDAAPAPEGLANDRLASAWTEEETLRAQLNGERLENDIPPEEFNLYQSCLEETLETPDEVWTPTLAGEDDSHKLYHFIRFYAEDEGGTWYLIIARETDEEDQLEILDAFPTRDRHLVDRYRQGTQEVGQGESQPAQGGSSRMLH